jgi:hypothetical protein
MLIQNDTRITLIFADFAEGLSIFSDATGTFNS